HEGRRQRQMCIRDRINLISKQQDFPNDDIGDGRRFYTDGPRVHEYLQEISEAVFQKYGSVTVGEMSSTTLEHCQQYLSLIHISEPTRPC
ncbi:alpha-amylase family glycosyl hydrolase, partial [Vibrio harveyi]|uniref:alpha-amylase family glycosyl hydrolase n=1 Tax=Vibrio harveyi TaxID=669 RepID=UPI001FD20533